MATTQELFEAIEKQLLQIKTQLRQPGGYPYDPHGLKKCLDAIIEGKFSPEQMKLLEQVGSITLPAMEAFSPLERFVLDNSDKAVVKIGAIGSNFRSWFLTDAKPEAARGPSTLRYYQMRRTVRDLPIIEALGGADKAPISLSELWGLMIEQPHGEAGALLNDNWYNVYYLLDIKGKLQAGIVHWYNGVWRLGADAIDGPCRWCEGDRVFAR